MLFLHYPKCSTCQKVKKYLDENKIVYTERNIKTDNPTYNELKEWHAKSGFELKKFFNTSGNIYKELKLKDKFSDMSDEEKLRLLATDGMLVKRPIALFDSGVLVGFKIGEWDAALLNSKTK